MAHPISVADDSETLMKTDILRPEAETEAAGSNNMRYAVNISVANPEAGDGREDIHRWGPTPEVKAMVLHFGFKTN